MVRQDTREPLPRTRVALVDDSEVYTRSIITMLAEHADLEVVGSAATGTEGIALVRRLDPDVVVLDLGLPDMSGWDVVAALGNARMKARIVILSSHDSDFHYAAAHDAGAAFVHKTRAAGELGEVVRRQAAVGRQAPGSSGGGLALDSETDLALRESEARFRATFDRAGVGMAHVAPDGRWLRVNQKLCDIVGRTREELLARGCLDLTHPDDVEADLDLMRQAVEEHLETFTREKRYFRRDGSLLWVQVTVTLVRTPAGAPDYFIAVTQDITERRHASDALREKTEQLEHYFTDALDLLCIASTEGHFLRLNPRWETTLGYPLVELEGQPFIDFVHPDDVEATLAAVSDLASQRDVVSFLNRYRCKDGSYRWFEWHARATGTQIHAAAPDMTERIEDQEALVAAQRLLTESQAVANVGSWAVALPTSRVSCSAQVYRVFGVMPEAVEHTVGGFLRLIHPQDRAAVLAWLAAMEGGVHQPDFEVRTDPPDQRTRRIRVQGALQSEGGLPVRIVGTVQDVTEQRATEAQLRHSQKMEAVGQLAGGVAHDFNNLLCVILSHADFAAESLGDGHPVFEDLEQVTKAGNRAAGLTRQLLAFSRRQVLEPRIVDLNQLVTELGSMLRRLIGENVELESVLASDLGRVQADPGQLEQVVTNLVVNARDAMESGGRITVETSNVEIDAESATRHPIGRPGPFVRLVVSDTGHGMDHDTKQRLFEPFFTTKEQGKGTGLGLSTVYGIVKQSGGEVEVYSERHIGTTFKVYLPRVDSPAQPALVPTETLSGGAETILVVEDEAAVRTLTARILRNAGYQVVVAANGAEALLAASVHRGEIHLLLTDVVMPQMSGPQVASRLTELLPDLRVLYASGYTADTTLRHGVLSPGAEFIGKPFSGADLRRKVRSVLDARLDR